MLWTRMTPLLAFKLNLAEDVTQVTSQIQYQNKGEFIHLKPEPVLKLNQEHKLVAQLNSNLERPAYLRRDSF